jgi:quinol monooxygenase YgiN
MKLLQNKKIRQTPNFKTFISFLILVFMMVGYHTVSAQPKEMIIRIAELEIHPNNLEEYKVILKEGAETAMKVEPGVISIFPMYQKANPNQIRILEIYASREAYELHLKTPHFQKYKTTTLHMVKSLQLTEMETIDAATMTKIFSKLKTNQ